MKLVTVGAVQMQCAENPEENLRTAERLIREAAAKGTQIILLPELFERLYFCQERRYSHYQSALPAQENPAVKRLSLVAKELRVVLPVSFYERDQNTLYNSVAVIDADGALLGVYRKTHLPDDHYYQEKFYFSPGNTGFRVWDTKYAKIGVGICWDQWFPETARSLCLNGAELLLFPTAIGCEPILGCDSMDHWMRCMQGQAAANLVPVIAANRFGTESVLPSSENGFQSSALDFYGSSFLTDETGAILAKADRSGEQVLTMEYDLSKIAEARLSWGIFRDRRPQCYGPLTD